MLLKSPRRDVASILTMMAQRVSIGLWDRPRRAKCSAGAPASRVQWLDLNDG